MSLFLRTIAAALALANFMTGAASAEAWRQTCQGAEYVCGKVTSAKAAPGKAVAAKPTTAKSSKVATISKAKAKSAAKTASVSKKPVKLVKVKAQAKAQMAKVEPKKAKPQAKVAKKQPAENVSGYQSGVASWYGGNFHGRKTANGETYDMYAMTAAHKTLPFGTRVRVTNANTGNSVVVRINDRGPFIAGRIIDLSKAAASDIGLTNTGVAPVKVAILGKG